MFNAATFVQELNQIFAYKYLTDENLKRTDFTWMLGQIKTWELASIKNHTNVLHLLGFSKGNFFNQYSEAALNLYNQR